MIRLITTKALKRVRHAVVRDRGEGGQALLLVLVVVFLLASLGAGLVASVTQELPFVSVATSEHAAYAALEAGVQNYRNDLNHDPTYYTYGTTAPVDAANPSMGTNTITAAMTPPIANTKEMTIMAIFQPANFGGKTWTDVF